VGALPVIIEDDVLIGGNCGVYEGTVVKKQAVLGTGGVPGSELP
jgi:2,3,4,5-tetrahydropyridine-2-carboxylate N-succinyltransferase